jgi:Cu/Ag efflux protein CusF
MTMGFRTEDLALFKSLAVGDNVRFTLKGIPPNLLITEIVRRGQS